MLSPEEIAEQEQLLAAHRHTLAIYLKQQAEIGHAYSPPALISGIDEARSNIRRIKAALKGTGVEVAEDPDDEEPPRLFGLPRKNRVPEIVLGLASVLVIALAIGAGWWFSRPPAGTLSQQATATQAETPPDQAPAGTTDLAALESQLAEANIALSATQVDQVREYINQPDTGYKLLAEHALALMNGQKFREMLYLDELDTRYTDLVGQDHYADFDEQQLKEGMLRAYNEHYTDNQASSFDEIVEPRP